MLGFCSPDFIDDGFPTLLMGRSLFAIQQFGSRWWSRTCTGMVSALSKCRHVIDGNLRVCHALLIDLIMVALHGLIVIISLRAPGSVAKGAKGPYF